MYQSFTTAFVQGGRGVETVKWLLSLEFVSNFSFFDPKKTLHFYFAVHKFFIFNIKLATKSTFLPLNP